MREFIRDNQHLELYLKGNWQPMQPMNMISSWHIKADSLIKDLPRTVPPTMTGQATDILIKIKVLFLLALMMLPIRLMKHLQKNKITKLREYQRTHTHIVCATALPITSSFLVLFKDNTM